MRYALLVAIEEREDLSDEAQAERYAEFVAFQDEMEARGVLVARERLRPTSLATTVRVRDEGLVIADGPFAETKEQICGYDVIDCADLDEAIDIAARHPVASWGSVEIRPFAAD
jgi:hypothetical protein